MDHTSYCHLQVNKALKRLILLLFMALTMPQPLLAQEWSPIGAKWHYTQWGNILVASSFKTIESIADTTINGVQCKIMIEKEL